MKKGFSRFLPDEPFRFRKVVNYFLQGMLIIAPIAVTFYALYWIVSTVDSWIPIFREPIVNADGKIEGYRVKNHGAGFLVILISIIFIGYLSSVFIRTRIYSLFDSLLEKAPGVKYIYSSVRDFFNAIAGEKKRFDKPVLVKIFADDVWILGFLTDDELGKFNLGAEMVSVYVPQAYNWAGQLYLVPRDRIRKIDKINAAEAMKYAVTGGVVITEEEKSR
ncbi:MAG: DUF502 domain-containing protein [Chitinophagaceae bacterium]|nr:DUF502 domain-containing protein [Chitinophagaceae bacterium]